MKQKMEDFMDKENKGMRLVAMIEKKNSEEYEVINFLPDIKVKHVEGKKFEVSENPDYVKIPYADGIDDLTVIVGENGVGKTSILTKIRETTFIYPDGTWLIYKTDNGYIYNDNKYFSEGIILNDVVLPSVNTKEVPVSILNFSNSVETTSSYDEFSVSTMARLLIYRDIETMMIKDMSDQISFLLDEHFNHNELEDLIKLDGKSIEVNIISTPFEYEDERLMDEFQEIYHRNSYSEQWFDLIRKAFEEQGITLKKLKEWVRNYLFFIASSLKNDCSLLKEENFLESLFRVRDETVFFDLIGLSTDFPQKISDWNQEYSKFELETKIERSSNNDTNLFYTYINQDTNIDKDGFFYKKCFGDGENREGYLSDYKDVYCAFLTTLELIKNKEGIIEILKSLYSGNTNDDLQVRTPPLEVLDLLDRLFNFSGDEEDFTEGLSGHDFRYKIKYHDGRYFIEDPSLELILPSIVNARRNEENSTWVELLNGELFQKFPILNLLLRCVVFEWDGLSSGEYAMLNLYGRLYSVPLSISQNIILLLDEVDLGLHPEWQRKWISSVLPIISDMFKEKHIQVIMTTHSPIMLSDIYSEDVIMLQKDSSGKRVIENNYLKTFGQNIHELYRSSFFLESMRGQYVSETINLVIQTLFEIQKEGINSSRVKEEFYNKFSIYQEQTDEQFKKCLMKIIDSIGETLISKKIMALYEEVFLNEVDINQRIQNLEMELDRLKYQRGDQR